MKGDQMGIRAAYPTPRELPLSNRTRFSLEGGRHVGRPIASAIISLQVTDLEPKSSDVDPLIKVLDYA
jgi:hypothetical protein